MPKMQHRVRNHTSSYQLDGAPAYKETVKNYENIIWNIESQTTQKLKEIGGLLSFVQKFLASTIDAAPPTLVNSVKEYGQLLRLN